MTNSVPTLVAGSGTFETSGTATLTLYGVQRETVRKTANIIEFPLPMQDSNYKLGMDLLGALREVSIEGIVTIADVGADSLYKYARDLAGITTWSKTLINGSQSGGYTYTSEILNRGANTNKTMTVYVTDVSITANKADPGSFHYLVSLMECTATT